MNTSYRNAEVAESFCYKVLILEQRGGEMQQVGYLEKDAKNRLLYSEYLGKKLRYYYNDKSLLKKIIDESNDHHHYLSTFNLYDEEGRLIKEKILDRNENIISKNTYEYEDNLLKKKSIYSPYAPLQNIYYFYNSRDLVSSETYFVDGKETKRRVFLYDLNDNKIKEEYVESGITKLIYQYEYDEHNRIIYKKEYVGTSTEPFYIIQYEYDENSNLTKESCTRLMGRCNADTYRKYDIYGHLVKEYEINNQDTISQKQYIWKTIDTSL